MFLLTFHLNLCVFLLRLGQGNLTKLLAEYDWPPQSFRYTNYHLVAQLEGKNIPVLGDGASTLGHKRVGPS